jgi:hypothetical protein
MLDSFEQWSEGEGWIDLNNEPMRVSRKAVLAVVTMKESVNDVLRI